jgi:glycosidase
MRKRRMALLCAAMMLCGVGCHSAEDVASDTQTCEDVTALSLMKEYNQGTENGIEDNYRTTYEVFLYSFYDSDGDGIGDLNGLKEKLDYINDGDPETDTDLGCNSIWLMPVMPSTTYHKYDVTDYCDIDAEYGTLEDFKSLVEACHKRGINVIIDLVMNHTSSQHMWFQTAAAYLESLPEGADPDAAECPYVDYYHFSKEKGAGYCQLADTDWYYEAQFWSEMPDLDLGNEAVRQEFSDIVDFWLELGVDGFRLDAAKEYYSGAVDANVEVLSWFNTMVKEKKEDAYIVAEVWNDLPVYAKYYASGIDSCFDFSFADSDGVIANVVRGTSSASSYGKALVNLQETLAQYSDSAIDAPFYTNHDLARGAGYYAGDNSEAQTKIAQAMNLFMTGNAFLYYGEELGMKGSGKDENKRAPMYWSEDVGAAGMCTGPADMDAIKMKYGSLEEQLADGNSIYYFVQQAISLRNQYPEIARGTVTFEESISDDQICGIRKTYEDSEILLIYNISDEERTVDLGAIAGKDGEVKVENTASVETEDTWMIGGELLTAASAAALEENTLTIPPYTVVLLTHQPQ